MHHPIEFKVLVPVIKKLLKKRGITYSQLADTLCMSEANVKKFINSDDCSLNRLNSICGILDVSLSDLLEMATTVSVPFIVLSEEQQEQLTTDETYALLYLKLAFDSVTLTEIRKGLQLQKREFFHMLRQLEKVGLIDVHSENKITVRKEYLGHWADNGPLAQLVKKEWGSSFIKEVADHPDTEGYSYELKEYRMTKKTALEFKDALKKVSLEFERRGELEAMMNDTMQPVSFLIAVAPDKITDIRMKDLNLG